MNTVNRRLSIVVMGLAGLMLTNFMIADQEWLDKLHGIETMAQKEQVKTTTENDAKKIEKAAHELREKWVTLHKQHKVKKVEWKKKHKHETRTPEQKAKKKEYRETKRKVRETVQNAINSMRDRYHLLTGKNNLNIKNLPTCKKK
jgi:hypothetical protein